MSIYIWVPEFKFTWDPPKLSLLLRLRRPRPARARPPPPPSRHSSPGGWRRKGRSSTPRHARPRRSALPWKRCRLIYQGDVILVLLLFTPYWSLLNFRMSIVAFPLELSTFSIKLKSAVLNSYVFSFPSLFLLLFNWISFSFSLAGCPLSLYLSAYHGTYIRW